jgi:hypothetical protein
MHRMRRQLHNSTIFDWLDAILARATQIMAAQGQMPERSFHMTAREDLDDDTRASVL